MRFDLKSPSKNTAMTCSECTQFWINVRRAFGPNPHHETLDETDTYQYPHTTFPAISSRSESTRFWQTGNLKRLRLNVAELALKESARRIAISAKYGFLQILVDHQGSKSLTVLDFHAIPKTDICIDSLNNTKTVLTLDTGATSNWKQLEKTVIGLSTRCTGTFRFVKRLFQL